MTIEATRIDWRDICFSLEWGGTRDDCDSNVGWMNWRLCQHGGLEVGKGNDEEQWDILFASKTSNHGRQTKDVTDAESLLEGFIKSDGCMQFWEGGHGFHVDDRREIRNMAEALERIRDLMRAAGHYDVEGREES